MEMMRYFRLVTVLTSANLKSRYRNTLWGFFWVLLNPILTYGVQVFAFTTIFQVRFANYPVYLLAGLFPWMFVVQSVEMCTGIFLNNGGIIKNIPVPPVLLVFVQILDNFINFICAFIILILYFSIFHSLNVLTVFYVLIPTIPLFIAVSSMCLIFSLLNIRFRDLKFIVSFVFSLLFYLTPIFYNIELVPGRLRGIIANNPFYYLIHPFQQILTSNGSASFIHTVGKAYLFSFVLLFLAYQCWARMKKYLVFYV